jgi:histidinol phosphatase-like PHP family hydrolase
MVINTDAHSPDDLIRKDRAVTILRAAGIPEESVETVFSNSRTLVNSVGRS